MAFIATDIFISWRGWNDIICKFLVYLYRSLRGLSLCTTSMLSVLQAIILSPRSSCLSKFKHISLHHILCAILFLSVLYMLISSQLLVSIIATPNLTTNDLTYVTQSCSILPLSYVMHSMYSTLLALREVFLISLMVLSTWYMVASCAGTGNRPSIFKEPACPQKHPQNKGLPRTSWCSWASLCWCPSLTALSPAQELCSWMIQHLTLSISLWCTSMPQSALLCL